MVRYLLFAAVLFALPHASWFPRRFEFDPADVPLGITNLILCVALVLWAIARATSPVRRNPFPAVNVFLAILVAWTAVAFVSGYTAGTGETLMRAKSEFVLMALYFVGLSVVHDRRDFNVFFAIALAIHALIGYEVFRTGVLGGSQFHVGKRASGPFGVAYLGSDVAGAYLAQVLMLFLAVVLSAGGLLWRAAAAGGAAIVFVGILATYSRGSLVGVIVGFLVMIAFKRPRRSSLLVAVVLVIVALQMLPQSTRTRLQETQDEEGQLDSSSQQRLDYYDAAWRAFKRHPMGAGTGQAPYAMKAELGWNFIVDPHNGFLQTLVQFGPIGVVVFLWMLGSVFRGASLVQGDEGAPAEYRAYALGTMGMVGALAACNLFYANFYKDLVMGTIALHFGLMGFVRQDEGAAAEGAADGASAPLALRPRPGDRQQAQVVEGRRAEGREVEPEEGAARTRDA